MDKNKLVNKITNTACKFGFVLKKHSPEILTTVGVVGTVTSAVMACKATTKLSAITSEAKESLTQIHEAIERSENLEPEVLEALDDAEYTEKDGKKDLAIIYAQTGLKIAKLYAPAIILGTLSIASLVGSSIVLKKRNAAMVAAYTTLNNSFKGYRSRVRERFGEAVEYELLNGLKPKTNKKGKKGKIDVDEDEAESRITEEKINSTNDPNQYNGFSRIYADGNSGWTKDATHNRVYLNHMQTYCNQILQERKYLFLNEVYEMLGFDKTKAGQVVGWTYDPDNPQGDNYVDFGLYDIHDKNKVAFINGQERNIILNFNVDGVILDTIKQY